METIIIHTDRDLTPSGKRSVRTIETSEKHREIRWYVSGEIYRRLPVTRENLDLSREWILARTQSKQSE